jgi:sirohydrochlorin cobaltochelatase
MIATGDKTRALILFAHGARDATWAEPFERLIARVRSRAPDRHVRLAFLEIMQPDLAAATAELISVGVTSIRILPIFFGQGGHLKRDLPAALDALRARHPGIEIDAAPPLGEDEAILEAMTAYCVGYLT